MTITKLKNIIRRMIVLMAIIIVSAAGIYLRFADLDANSHLFSYFACNKIIFDQGRRSILGEA